LPKSTIAIVDDDEAVRIGVDSLLRSAGHHCIMFGSAEAFLASNEASKAACIICDIRMDGMSGLDLQEVLLARNYGIPIIFITAFSSPDMERRAASSGALCVLPKPFDRGILLAAVQQALASRRDI
jgi:FixJ family two-component response regulator